MKNKTVSAHPGEKKRNWTKKNSMFCRERPPPSGDGRVRKKAKEGWGDRGLVSTNQYQRYRGEGAEEGGVLGVKKVVENIGGMADTRLHKNCVREAGLGPLQAFTDMKKDFWENPVKAGRAEKREGQKVSVLEKLKRAGEKKTTHQPQKPGGLRTKGTKVGPKRKKFLTYKRQGFN